MQVVNAPRGLGSVEGAATTKSARGAAAVFVYCATSAEVAKLIPKPSALDDGARLQIAYPKVKQLGTDLNRDILWKHVEPSGWRPVRQVAIDDIWSAMMFLRGE